MPSQVARFDPDGSTPSEINDEDIKKAFEARPQLGEHVNVAYVSFDAAKNADVEKALRAIPAVGSVYSIPALAVTGAHRFDDGWAAPAQPLSIKKLRLLAARAHCDVVIVVDYGYRTKVSANGLAALDVLLVPALFLPFREIEVQSYMEASIIDTRNGYLYGDVTSSRESKKSYQTIYANEDDLVAAQWGGLKVELQDSMAKVMEAERTKAIAKEK